MLGERLVELLPRAAGLGHHVHILGVDLADLVHPPHIDQNRPLDRRRVALGVGHATAPGKHHEAVGIGSLDDRCQLFGRARLCDDGGQLVGLEADIGREELASALV